MGSQGLTGFSEAGEKSVKTCNCFIVFSMKKKCLCVMDAEVKAQAVVCWRLGAGCMDFPCRAREQSLQRSVCRVEGVNIEWTFNAQYRP